MFSIKSADHILDIGPGAGVHGGEIIAQGTLEDIIANKDSLTGQYLAGIQKIEVPTKRVKNDPEKQLILFKACANNLKYIDLKLPLGLLTCVTGVSGSGKSTLINNTLYPLAATKLNNATIDVSHLSSGMYLIAVSFQGKINSRIFYKK